MVSCIVISLSSYIAVYNTTLLEENVLGIRERRFTASKDPCRKLKAQKEIYHIDSELLLPRLSTLSSGIQMLNNLLRKEQSMK